MSARTRRPNTPIQISARLKVQDLSVLARSTEAIPDAADGMNERIRLLIVYLAPYPPDIDVDDVGGRIEMKVPYVLEQHGARHDSAFVADQIFEQLEFPRKELDFTPAPARGPRHEIDLEIADAQHRLPDHGGAATSESLDARQQLREGKRLDEVIVPAGTQTADPVIDLAERADDQDRRGDALLPQLLHHRNSIEVREQAIDCQHGIGFGAAVTQRVIAVRGEVDLISVGRKRVDELARCHRVILDHENAAPVLHHGVYAPLSPTDKNIFIPLRLPGQS